MITCPSCGMENLDAARFCMNCATPLGAAPPLAEERKTVTTLICDLVGFTAMSEAADPEDVDRLLNEYFSRATKAIESHGGIVEKFIGDAVVGVFGVPAVHEDDPERAVRAGLRLIEALEGLTRPDGSPLEARIGINTGEALVRLEVDPASGRGFLTGDAVNVAARLQAAAPPNGVAVGALTHRLTSSVIVYEELPLVTAKGKAEPVEAWLAQEPLARTGGPVLGRGTPFVDRAVEIGYLKALLDKATDSSSPQIALVIGEAGIGKSRLAAELFFDVDAETRLVTWRQGRCPPYGEGVTFWALVEILKAHAGILETDGHDAVEAKLEQVLPDTEERPWFRQRLRALLGLEAAKAGREENFTAWLRFLEDMAAREPTVVVIEDLQWAEEGLLAFLEHLTSHVAHVPLMLVLTARPELFERHPSFAAAVRINRIVLEPLSDRETEDLVASVLEEPAGDLRAWIAKQAEGNPFYAEESARLVMDRAEGLSTLPIAGSVHGVIAARLDSLETEAKVLLSKAAIAGNTFWDGLLAAMAERSMDEVTRALEELVARQLIYRVQASSMAGEREYEFGHTLLRDVAYGELPRRTRARGHATIARWIEGKAGDHPENFAEVLAHHYVTALDLARAAGDTEVADSLLEPAIDNLTIAGDRAVRVDVGAAERHYTRALDLAGDGADQRPELLSGWAMVLFLSNRHRESVAYWGRAIEGFRASGELRRAAVAMSWLGAVYEILGEPFAQTMDSACDLLADDGPSPELATVLAYAASSGLLTGRREPQDVIDAEDRVIDICGELGLPEPAWALSVRAMARIETGDAAGMEDFDRALAAAKAQGLTEELAYIQYNYAQSRFELSGAEAALRACLDGLDRAERQGNQTFALGFRADLMQRQYFSGDWDEVLQNAEVLASALEQAEASDDLCRMRAAQAFILAAQGRPGEAKPFITPLLEKGRRSENPWTSAHALTAAAVLSLELAQCEVVRELLGELRIYKLRRHVELGTIQVRTAMRAGEVALAGGLIEDLPPLPPLCEHTRVACLAMLAEAGGGNEAAREGYANAAARWHDFGVPYEEAQALLGQGRCLVALGKAPEAAAPLAEAHAIFAKLGAKPALAETDELMQWIASA